MTITVYTSAPGMVDRLFPRGRASELVPVVDVLPEDRWLHPRARMQGLISLIKEGDEHLAVLTWDELSMLVCMSAAAEGVADVEVKYFTDGADEPVVLKADGRGALPSWPDPSGFFNERRDVLFSDGPLFGKEAADGKDA